MTREDQEDVPLPSGWASTTLEGIASVNGGLPCDPPDDVEVSFVPMKCVQELTGHVDVSLSRRYGHVKKGYTAFTDDDVIFAKITPCMENGKVGLPAGLTNGIGVGSTEFHVVRRLDPHIPREFLFHFLVRQDFRREARMHMTGSAGQLRVPKAYLSEVSVPLPPFPEQHRIVARIEEMFSRLDAGEDALRQVKAQLSRYRQSVLKSAFDGSLTAEWREAHKDELEPASVLLERIMEERRARSESAGRRRGGSWEPPTLNASILPLQPEGWAWTTIGQCFDVHIGSTPKRARPEYWGGGIPWVSSGEVSFNRIIQTRETVSAEGLRNTSIKLHPAGTVLLGMIGEGKTRGQVAVLDIAACNNQNSAAIRVSQTEVHPEYVFYYLWGQYQTTRNRGSGGNQPALNRARVQEIPLPLPPLVEQQRIVEGVERYFSIAEAVETSIEQSLAESANLRQSILKTAFEGKLVPQDPDDEPAERLLERIAAERAKNGSAKGPRRTRAGNGGS